MAGRSLPDPDASYARRTFVRLANATFPIRGTDGPTVAGAADTGPTPPPEPRPSRGGWAVGVCVLCALILLVFMGIVYYLAVPLAGPAPASAPAAAIAAALPG